MVLRTELSMIWIGRPKIPWLILGLDPTWKFNFENKFDTLTYLEVRFILFHFESKFDTLAYPEARFILKVQLWKQIWYPDLPRGSIHFESSFGNKFDTLAYLEARFILKVYLEINSIPWFIPRLDSFRRSFWQRIRYPSLSWGSIRFKSSFESKFDT